MKNKENRIDIYSATGQNLLVEGHQFSKSQSLNYLNFGSIESITVYTRSCLI